MTDDRPDLLEKLPELFLKSLKKRMLRGDLPSKAVEEILSPLIEDFDRLKARLSPTLRNDVENILKIYPELADRYGIALPHSVFYALDTVWERFGGAGSESTPTFPPPGAYPEGDMASPTPAYYLAEDQNVPEGAASAHSHAGRSTLITDRGNAITLSVHYDERERSIRFIAPELAIKVAVRLCGRPALILDPENPSASLTIEEFVRIVGQTPEREVDLELIEEAPISETPR